MATTSDAYTPVTEMHSATSTGRRTAFARWLTAPDNPLVARVAVNHIWNRHFGRALVESVFDFGQNGKLPDHPALLDWLASEFMQPTYGVDHSSHDGQPSRVEPWSMKHVHRLLVTSSAYRMASQAADLQVASDPDNRFWTRLPVRRMEAEVVRDSILFLAGQLDLRMGGADIDHALGFSVPRRSMYFRHAPEKEMTFLQVFDSAAVTECYQRKSSIMPQQALAMANSELTIVQARRLARNGMLSRPMTTDEFIDTAFEHLLSRRATQEERDTCRMFITQRSAQPSSAEVTALSPDLTRPSSDPDTRAREQLVHVLMNHHEFVTIN